MPSHLDDDTFTELAEEERRRLRRRRSGAPVLRLFAAAAIVVLIVILAALFVRDWLHDRQVAAYDGYTTEIAQILKTSDAMGSELSQILLQPGDSTRKDLQGKLDSYLQKSQQLTQRATEVETPEDLVEAHKWFVAALQLRAKGLETLKPSLMNALEVQDAEVASEQVATAMQNLLVSDVIYGQLYVEAASSVLQEKEIEGVALPASDFLTDHDLASKSKLKTVIATLKESENLQEVHGVALIKVVVMPAEKVVEPDGSYTLTATDELAFEITMENQGNETETDVPVSLKLISSVNPQPQLKTEKIPEVKPNEQKTIRISGINPTEYGEKAELQVEVGPVPNEKLVTNNSLKATVTFTL